MPYRIMNRPHIIEESDTNSPIDPSLVTFHSPSSRITEEYRILRTNIQQLINKTEHVSLIITSAVGEEGKSITSSNLAIAMAYDSKETLLVDTDMRKPHIHQLFDIPLGPGFADLLKGEGVLDSMLKESTIPHLTILPAGNIPPNPAELLSSSRGAEIIALLKSQFEIVIFDSPPLIYFTDAAVLGGYIDGVILIIQSWKTQRQLINHAISLLKSVHTNILGFVLTKSEPYIPEVLMPLMIYYKYY